MGMDVTASGVKISYHTELVTEFLCRMSLFYFIFLSCVNADLTYEVNERVAVNLFL